MARRALGPATLAVVQAVRNALSPADGALLVACSGGADSLALAAATQLVGPESAGRCAAVVVDHGLQPGSTQVAVRAREQLTALGFADVVLVPVVVGTHGTRCSRGDGGSSLGDAGSHRGSGPEAAARQARYAALQEEANRRDATVLLGHTRDDQAETVLLGLARGSGTRSLAGMAGRTGPWLRPLLGVDRATTRAVCDELGLVPWDDPHNLDDSYTRVRVRRHVLPQLEAQIGPGVAAALARTAELARVDADLLDDLATAAHPPTPTLDCDALEHLHPALRTRVLRAWLLRSGVPDVGLGHVAAVEALVIRWHGQRGVDLPGARAVRADGRLRLEAPPVAG